MSRKNKKEREPQYYLSCTHIQTINYKVYYMSKVETILYFLLAFVVGGAVGYLFYGGIGVDSYGNPTTLTYVLNTIVTVGVGLLAGKLFLPIRTQQILDKRRKDLGIQFRDMLEGLTTSLGAGNNVMNSFRAVQQDLQIQYPEDAFILQELEVILSGMASNFSIEDMLEDFGARSGIADIQSFAGVFRVCYRKGGDIKDIIISTNEVISKKMEIRADIETTVSGSEMDQMIMIIMPIALVAVIKVMSPEFGANFATAAGLVATTIAVGLFIAAYFVGKSIMKIEI